jgi:hypothetical protein
MENMSQNDVVMDEDAENAEFHTVSEGIAERDENDTDHVVQNNGQELQGEVSAEKILQENAAMDAAIRQMPQNKLEEFASRFLYFAAQKGIISYDTIASGNISEMLNEVDQRFQEMQQAEDMVIILEAEMKGIQTQAEELFEQKDMEYEQVIADKSAEADKTNAKMTQKLRDSGQHCVSLNNEIRQLQEEIQSLLDKIEQLQAEIQGMKFADCSYEGNRTLEGESNPKKWRTSLSGGTVDRKDAGKMVMVFSMSTNVMTKNAHRDKEQERTFKAISSVMTTLEISASTGWLASEKLKVGERNAIVKEIENYATETGFIKLTAEKAKDWCNVCCVFIEDLGKLTPVLQRGALVNMFRAMVDNGGDIEAGIMAYSELVKAEKDKLTTEAYDKLLEACNDDGAIILKLIKSLLEPLSTDIVQELAGEEAGVGLHDIGNAIVETWTALSVAKGCLEESFVTDAGENF